MATTEQVIKPFTIQELKGKAEPDWCPGCGDFGVLAALEKAIVDLVQLGRKRKGKKLQRGRSTC
jgi:pyruvate/2-oxoacid:ferredoxin oxidoreductase beta subunit